MTQNESPNNFFFGIPCKQYVCFRILVNKAFNLSCESLALIFTKIRHFQIKSGNLELNWKLHFKFLVAWRHLMSLPGYNVVEFSRHDSKFCIIDTESPFQSVYTLLLSHGSPFNKQTNRAISGNWSTPASAAPIRFARST